VLLNWIFLKSSAAVRYTAGLSCLALTFLSPVLTFWWLSVNASATANVISSTETMSGILLTQQATLFDVLNANFEFILPYIVLLWIVGVSGLSARAVIGWRLVQHFRRKDVSLGPDWLAERVQYLADSFGIRQKVLVLQSLRVEVPTVIGWLKPVILLPVSALIRLDPEQVEMVLAHELGHIRRYDYIVNLFQVFLETVLFYHPVVRWMSKKIRQERENCCDDLVIATCGKPVVYAKALANLEELRGGGHGHVEPALAATGGDLLARVKRIARGRHARTRPVKGSLMIMAAVSLVSLMAAQSRLIDHDAADFDQADAAGKLMEADHFVDSPEHREAWLRGLALLPQYAAQEKAAKEVTEAKVIENTYPEAANVPISTSFTPVAAQVETTEAEAQPATVETPVVEVIEQPVAEMSVAAEEPPQRHVLSVAPTRIIAPKYPAEASRAGIEGFVKLEFSVSKRGRVKDIRVVDAFPEKIFDRDAVRAMKRFRFEKPDELMSSIRLSQTFDFVLSNDPVQLADSSQCTKLGNGYCAALAISRIEIAAIEAEKS
jgi:TonB family protein